MDTLLQQGQHAKASDGRPISIDGIDELLQQAIISLTIPKGSFSYDKELGSLIHTLQSDSHDSLQQQAFRYVQEALFPLSEIMVEDVTCMTLQTDELQLGIRLKIKDLYYSMEVNI